MKNSCSGGFLAKGRLDASNFDDEMIIQSSIDENWVVFNELNKTLPSIAMVTLTDQCQLTQVFPSITSNGLLSPSLIYSKAWLTSIFFGYFILI